VREVHHRIKNHLQGVVTLLRNRAAERPDVAIPLEEAIGQINTIAQIYGLQGRDGAVSLGRIAAVAVASVAVPATIRYDAPAEDGAMRVNPQEVVPVALVVNELVTNAAKHTASPAGVVEMAVARTAGGAVLRIENGPASLPSGFDFGAGRGLGTGLELLRALLPPKGATLSLRGESDRVVAELSLAAPVLEAA
jgi:two-component sensor histidine kinase